MTGFARPAVPGHGVRIRTPRTSAAAHKLGATM